MITPPGLHVHHIYDILLNRKLGIWFRSLVGFIVTGGGLLSRLAQTPGVVVDTLLGD
jgi:hypothetical protein